MLEETAPSTVVSRTVTLPLEMEDATEVETSISLTANSADFLKETSTTPEPFVVIALDVSEACPAPPPPPPPPLPPPVEDEVLELVEEHEDAQVAPDVVPSLISLVPEQHLLLLAHALL